MSTKSHFTIPTAMFVVATIISASALSASPALQFKPSRSDEDIDAIGHRTIGKDTNFYSTDKENALGKGMAREVSAPRG